MHNDNNDNSNNNLIRTPQELLFLFNFQVRREECVPSLPLQEVQ